MSPSFCIFCTLSNQDRIQRKPTINKQRPNNNEQIKPTIHSFNRPAANARQDPAIWSLLSIKWIQNHWQINSASFLPFLLSTASQIDVALQRSSSWVDRNDALPSSNLASMVSLRLVLILFEFWIYSGGAGRGVLLLALPDGDGDLGRAWQCLAGFKLGVTVSLGMFRRLNSNVGLKAVGGGRFGGTSLTGLLTLPGQRKSCFADTEVSTQGETTTSVDTHRPIDTAVASAIVGFCMKRVIGGMRKISANSANLFLRSLHLIGKIYYTTISPRW